MQRGKPLLLAAAGLLAVLGWVGYHWRATQEGPRSQARGSHHEVREPASPTPHLPMTSSGSHQPNRLIHEKSPYLQQHAYNPVDWYPWGEEAFAQARKEGKPIFLSIGYSTCHWCHVMERESFENPEIAALLNRWFVSIKVDREEHPDVDQVYMHAVQAMSGQGGWPLTVILTPDLKPFFGGTYFPPEPRMNMPGMTQLLPSIADVWHNKREEVVRSATHLTEMLQQELSRTHPGTISLETLNRAFSQAVNLFDAQLGGFGGAPKFPRGHELSFLLRYGMRTGAPEARQMVVTTLEHLAGGGIHDHLGGGFHRYSTDARWLVPHFEKMLYDQALVAQTFVEAYQATRTTTFAEVARDIFEYVLRDLTDPQGGFYSAEDADSEGEEGKFYVWRPDEVIGVLGQEEGALMDEFYGVTQTGHLDGQSILHVEEPLEDFAKLKGLDPRQLTQRLTAAREKLLEVRSRRVRPHRDDKILTSWNGLMIASLADGAAVLGDARYLEAAKRAADFILTTLRRDGALLRRYRAGEAKYPGTLDDYAFFSYGLLELYEASFEPRWLAEAKQVAYQMVERFWDSKEGGFFFQSAQDDPLIARAKELYDGATPSGNSIAALVLLKLGRLTADQALESYGYKLLEAFAAQADRDPFAYPQLLTAWDFALGPTKEIVIAGNPTDSETMQMIRTVRMKFLPRAVTVLHPDGASAKAIEALAPYVKAQRLLNGHATAYVCERHVCQLPTTNLDEFARLLDASALSPAR